MKITTILCDGCEKPIDLESCVELAVLRGGADLVVRNTAGVAREPIRETRHFCASGCLANWVEKIAATAKPEKAEKPAPSVKAEG